MPGQRRGEPSALVAKLILKGSALYAILSTFANGLRSFLLVLARKGDSMLFTAAAWILYVGLGLGIVLCILLCYYFKWVEFQKHHPDEKVKFDVKYFVAGSCTLIVSILVSYVIMFYGINYIAPDTTITEEALAFLTAFLVGGVTTYIMDACIFHPLADGSAAIASNKLQEAIRQAAASEEARKALFNAVADKAQALGLVDEKKIEALAGMVSVKGVDDPNFALYCQMLLNTP